MTTAQELSSLELNNDKMFINDILIIKNAFSFNRELIEQSEKLNEWTKSSTHGESLGYAANPNDRTSYGMKISNRIEDVMKDFDTKLYKAFNEGLNLYVETMDASDIGITSDSGYDMLKYEVGGHYKVHIDRGSRTDQNRALSGLIYLNDDYVGGELYFPRQKLKIKPQEGMLVLFPSTFTHPHASLDIISGTKYCVVTWFS